MSVHHVALEARPADREPLAAFFALLGFARVRTPTSLGDAIWLERDGTQVHVLVAEEGATASSRGHVAVVCPDYEEALERLRAAGFAPEPRREHWGSPRCFVRAPGGHRVEVMKRRPGAFA